MRAAVYKCSHCKFQDIIAVRDLNLLYTFDEKTSQLTAGVRYLSSVENSFRAQEVPDKELPEHPDITAMCQAGKLDEFIAQYKTARTKIASQNTPYFLGRFIDQIPKEISSYFIIIQTICLVAL